MKTRTLPIFIQCIICISLVLVVSGISFFSLQHFIGYREVALILLTTVSIIAILFGMVPVIIAAIMSAFIWNFFFIPPLFTFHIERFEDVLFFFLYFFIALINTVLTIRIRQVEQKARDREEKENILRLYKTLFNSLSHELRTPISTIIGAMDTIKENRSTLSGEDFAELLSVIDNAGDRLNREVENLLNMSRLESGTLTLNTDWVDLEELIRSVIRKLPSYGKHIEFHPVEDLPFFRLDEGIMEKILYNLLHNALIHTPENAMIRIVAEHFQDACIITISDSGQGFPENEIPLVFNKFYRLRGSTSGGSGLGLSIVKGFVEAHKGTVALRNGEDGGAEFTIFIPADATYINSLKNE